MTLNHINLVVTDVAGTIRLFEQFFGFTCSQVKGNNIVAVMTGADGFTLVIMKGKEGETVYPGAFHIGFMLDTEDDVLATFSKLKQGGINGVREPGKIRDSFGFYFNFDAIMIEVGTHGK